MSVVDDPVLALIARFVVDDIHNLRISDEVFLQHQVAEIRRHVGDAAGEERQRLAMQWITEHAEYYRREWQQKELSRIALNRRCADCPLKKRGTNRPYCTIHSRWIALLRQYLASRIGSQQYVEETLELLYRHKKNLKISSISAQVING